MEFLAALIFLRIVIWTIKDVQRFEHRFENIDFKHKINI